jgi:hypothetical protein
MRLYHAMLLIPLFTAPVLAQTVSPPTTEHHARKSAADHFADANTTHDGHLTLDQATAGYKSLAKSFSQIDVQHHGYITLDDIKAWKASKKAEKQAAKHAAEDAASGVLRPVPAVMHGDHPKASDTSTYMIIPAARRTGVDLPPALLNDEKHPS